jgi:ADP-ribosylglycohydrolase
MPDLLHDRTLGCLLGGLIGDAMGRPAENKTWRQIEAEFGRITDFSGSGTDDSALKHLLCDAILRAHGPVTPADWAEEWLRQEDLFLNRNLFWTPVMNAFWKVRSGEVPPAEAGLGNMASSSSAMCISPIGIINPGDPGRAYREAFDAAGLIHHNYCRDAAALMAAAIAAAMAPDATVDSVLARAVECLPPDDAGVMRGSVAATLRLARETGDFAAFRARFYDELMLPRIAAADSRETVPVALALFLLAGGDPREAVIMGANFGRDADTIASMAGALAGAFRGASALPPGWAARAAAGSGRDQEDLARALEGIARSRAGRAR